MTDIVERLRKGDVYGGCKHDRCMCVLMDDAADEIERLREILQWVIKLPEDSRIHAKVARKAFQERDIHNGK